MMPSNELVGEITMSMKEYTTFNPPENIEDMIGNDCE